MDEQTKTVIYGLLENALHQRALNQYGDKRRNMAFVYFNGQVMALQAVIRGREKADAGDGEKDRQHPVGRAGYYRPAKEENDDQQPR